MSIDYSRLHPDIASNLITTEQLSAMTVDELRQVFPAWDAAAKDIIRACIKHRLEDIS